MQPRRRHARSRRTSTSCCALNGAAVDDTVAANAWCEVEGIGERLARAGSSAATSRAQVLKARRIDQTAGRADAARALQRPLPNGARAAARLGQGHRRGEQPEGRHDDRAALSASRCAPPSPPSSAASASAPNAPCLPIRPMSVRFIGAGRARARRPGAPASGRRRAARAGVRQGRQGDRGQRDRVPEAARRERRVQRSRCRRRCATTPAARSPTRRASRSRCRPAARRRSPSSRRRRSASSRRTPTRCCR